MMVLPISLIFMIQTKKNGTIAANEEPLQVWITTSSILNKAELYDLT